MIAMAKSKRIVTEDVAMELRADFARREVVLPGGEAWRPSSMAGAERYMLDRIGEEVARETAIVRYAAGLRTHGGGEVHGAGIAGDEHEAAFENRAEDRQLESAREVDDRDVIRQLRAHLVDDRPIARAARQHERRVELPGHASGRFGEPLRRPLLDRTAPARMERDHARLASDERRRVATQMLIPRTDRNVAGGDAWLSHVREMANDRAKTVSHLRTTAMLDMAPAA